jgi:outer membrane protein assembly complex protein YaeT
MADRGYFRAGVEAEIRESNTDTRVVLFHIEPGIHHEGLSVSFPGAQAIPPSSLRQLLEDGGFMDDLYARTAEAARFIRQHYLSNGFPEAAVAEPLYELDIDTRIGGFVFPVTEGRLYRFGGAEFSGNRAISSERLRSLSTAVESGQPASQASAERAQTAIRDFYQDEGFAESVVRYRFDADTERAVTLVKFEIQENGRRVLESIEVTGNRRTSPGLIRSEIALDRGDVVNSRSLVRARNNLYSTGAYASVDIEVVKQQESAPGEDVAVNLAVRVREVAPLELRYGGFYDTERGVGGIADLVSTNILGGSRTAGLRTRYDADLREARIYFSQPPLRRLPLKSLGSVFYRREVETGIITDSKGVTGNVEYRLGEFSLIDAGYRFEWVHVYEKMPDPQFPFDIRLRVAPLTGSYARDTRDDVLDATRGSLFSHAVEWTPSLLGSGLRYIKYFGQYFRNFPLGGASRVPWVGVTRNRTVYTLGARVGLIHGFEGQTIVESERFFSGGGTTVRGFEQNSLGPRGFDDTPSGGNAVFVLNNEIRFPLYSLFDGVGFFDAGNVYRYVEDFSLKDLRTSAGFGLRIRTPYGVIRADYGVNLRPHLGENRTKLYFSIGQAF